MNLRILSAFPVALAAALAPAQFRINHNGRILGPLPTVTQPLQFDTAAADSVISAMQITPTTSAYNEDVSRLPLLANSDAMISNIITNLRSDRQHLTPEFEMNFCVVPDSQALQPINFTYYPDQSDPSPYPIPDICPVEPWPIGYGVNGASLYTWQQIGANSTDAHAIMVQPGTSTVWETWLMQRNADKSWMAANGAKFNIGNNSLRPDGWTSGDAAGLCMFGNLVRYDECERGMVEHAVRLVVHTSRQNHLYPATHDAGSTADTNAPRMGERLRLKANFQVPANWTKEEKAVCAGLKKYGGMVADNGNFFSFSVAPDDRFASGCFDNLNSIPITDFEVVQSTGANGGPRSANPPVCNAGPNLTVSPGAVVDLNGTASGGSAPLTVQWTKYSGPGTVQFGNAASAKTTLSCSVTGSYVVMLQASDGVHTPAYSAINVTAQPGSSIVLSALTLSKSSIVGGNLTSGQVALNGVAAQGNVPVALSSSNPSALQVAASVVVPAGKSSKAFTVITSGVSASVLVQVTATLNSFSLHATMTVKPAAITGLTTNAASVVGGNQLIGTMTFSGKTPSTTGTATLSSSNPAATFAATALAVPAGVTHLSFGIQTLGVSVSTQAIVTAKYLTGGKAATITINPASIKSFTANPDPLTGGSDGSVTIVLDGKAPQGGFLVNLTSDNAACTVPATATVGSGHFSVKVTIPSSAVQSQTVVTLTANHSGAIQTYKLTVSP